MTATLAPANPPIPRYAEVPNTIIAELGRDTIDELRQGDPRRDAWWTIWPPLAVLANAIAIGNLSSWYARIPLMIFQAFLITNCAMAAHSLAAHRRPFGDRIGRWQGRVLGTITFLSSSVYAAAHKHHHAHVNTPKDQEVDQADLDRAWKRLVYLTPLGYLAGGARLLAPRASKDRTWRTRTWHRRKMWATPAGRRILLVDWNYVALHWATVASLAVPFPEVVLAGYVVPLVFGAPAANSLREATEHFDVDLGNPWNISTLYEPGWFLRTFGGHQVGTSHWVHHIWADIPHYRLPEAWALIRPLALERGVTMRTSYFGIIRDFLRGQSRTWYRDSDGHRVDVPTLTAYGDPDLARRRRAARPS